MSILIHSDDDKNSSENEHISNHIKEIPGFSLAQPVGI